MSFVTKKHRQVKHESLDVEMLRHGGEGRDGRSRWALQRALSRREGEKGGGIWRYTWQGGDCSRTRDQKGLGLGCSYSSPVDGSPPHHLGPPRDLGGGGGWLVGKWGQKQGQHGNPGRQQQKAHWQNGSDHFLCPWSKFSTAAPAPTFAPWRSHWATQS